MFTLELLLDVVALNEEPEREGRSMTLLLVCYSDRTRVCRDDARLGRPGSDGTEHGRWRMAQRRDQSSHHACSMEPLLPSMVAKT